MRWLALPLLLAGCAEVRLPQRSSTMHLLTDGACGLLSWPADAVVSSGFGVRDARPHQGIDLAIPEGTPVRAACAGVVTYADDKLRGYGRLVILEHAGGLTTVYAHNEALLVATGAHVLRGQLLSRSGQTGHVTAPHLHFEVRRDGRPIDPLGVLGPRAPRSAGPLTSARRASR